MALKNFLVIFVLTMLGAMACNGKKHSNSTTPYTPPPTCDKPEAFPGAWEDGWGYDTELQNLPKYEDKQWADEGAISASITAEATQYLGKINTLIYGNNSWIENTKMGFPTKPTAAEYPALREQFDDYFRLFSEMNPTLIRIPGGLQANHDRWEDFSGPFEQRPIHNASGVPQYSVAGIDEHIDAAADILSHGQIIYTLNAYPAGPFNLTAGGDEARGLVEFLRQYEASKGRRVTTHFEVGNELNSQLKLDNPAYDQVVGNYAKVVSDIADSIRSTDPTARQEHDARLPYDKRTVRLGALDDFNNDQARWYQLVCDQAGNDFDFWIKHYYSPGNDGNVRGFSLRKPGVKVKSSKEFTQSGTYTFELVAEGIAGTTFDLLIDDRRIQTFTIDAPDNFMRFYQVVTQLGSGEHTVAVVSGNNVTDTNYVRLNFTIAAWIRPEEEVIIDLKNDQKIAEIVAAGPRLLENQIQKERERYCGKPLVITEWNTLYSFDECTPFKGPYGRKNPARCSKLDQLREAINVADYYQVFIDNPDLIKGANFWLLFTELGNLDLGENGDGLPNPSFHVAKLYGNNLIGERIQTTIQSDTFKVGRREAGITMGVMDKFSETMNYVTAVASNNCTEVAMAIINKHPEKTADVALQINGIDLREMMGDSELAQQLGQTRMAHLWQISGDSLGSKPRQIEHYSVSYNIADSGNEFNLKLPPHSITLIKSQL